jgi:hypothetical protein
MTKELTRHVDTVTAYGGRMVDLYFLLDQRLEILYSFSAKEIVEPLRESNGANTYNVLVTSLSIDIARDLYALVLDRAEETLSVRNVWRLVQRPGLLEVLRKRFAQNQDEGAVQFDASVTRLRESVPTLLDSPRSTWLKNVRHRSIAHREMTVSTPGESQTIDVHNFFIGREDLRDYLLEAQPVVADLGLVAASTERNWELARRYHRLFVADFWSRLQGSGPVHELPEDASPPHV